MQFIALERVEGPDEECVAVCLVPTKRLSPWTQAQRQLEQWSQSAPQPGAGHHSVAYEVKWDTHIRYTGTFNLQQGGVDDGDALVDHVRRGLLFYAGRQRLPRLSEDTYRQVLRDFVPASLQRACGRILDTCQIGEPASSSPEQDAASTRSMDEDRR